jgi:hypothetical protein
MKEGVKGSRLSYAVPGPEGVLNEKNPLPPSHQPSWAFESKQLKAKTTKFESSWIRFSLSN